MQALNDDGTAGGASGLLVFGCLGSVSIAGLIEWVSTHLPETAVIAQNSLVNIPDPALPNHRYSTKFLPHKIMSATCLTQFGNS